MNAKRLALGLLALVAVPLCAQDQRGLLVSAVLEQPQELALFIDNVLRQLPSEKVIECAQACIQESSQAPHDAQLYEGLAHKLATHRNRKDVLRVIKLIWFQKQLLGKQIKALLGESAPLQNCLEIGTPGTYTSTISDRVKGKIYTLLEKIAFTDVLQAHSFSPSRKFKGYHEALRLNDYEPISSQIPDASLDLIICTIGLHHCPPHKLDAFIASIHRILRPGGAFLLREHNASSPKLVALASAAHSIFNVIIPQEPVEAEMREVRNFQSLEYWKALLKEQGFNAQGDEYLQEGDSTLNTFVKFTKRCVTFEESVEDASQQAQKNSDYAREGVQTYLTTPEWNNVDAAQHYGEYINRTPFYEFPYMAHIATYWRTFAQSWRCVAQEKGGNLKTLFSPNVFMNYTFMNLFVGVFMTVEYTAKAAISLPVRLMFSGMEAPKLLALVHDPEDVVSQLDPAITLKIMYGKDIKLVYMPRYVDFLASIKKLAGSSVTLLKVAGNEKILCKIRYKGEAPASLKSSWVKKFTWKMPTLPEYTYAAYLVPVRELTEFVGVVEPLAGCDLLYIHDF